MNYEELVAEAVKHNHLYYNLNKPKISDEIYDVLYDTLEIVEKKQGWTAFESPTLKVGGQPGKIKHKFSLYSLKKVYNKDEIDPEFTVVTPKIDGANLTITFTDGKISHALTRGNGEFGDSVLHLIKYLKSIPQEVPYKDVTITGECVTDNDVKNFRNYVAGALGLKHAEDFKNRNIKFIAHDWLGCAMNYTKRMDILSNMGFETVFTFDKDKYPSDGLVYRLDSFKKSEELGYTSKYPRFSIALKERGVLTAVTSLQKVEWVVGRTGTVNPVGIIDPVVLDGATIARVTLHNISIIEAHKLGLGDTIEIERAGGVIPKFNRVLAHSPHNSRIELRHAEQAIGGPVRRVGPKLYIVNDSQNNNVKLLEHFVKTLGIKGLGPKSIAKLNITHPEELYKKQPWESLGANGAKIIQEIEMSKTKPFELVLAALGIPGVGRTASRAIVQHIPSFQRLRDVETTQIKGIGPKTVEQILVWLIHNEEWVCRLPLQLERNKNIGDVLNANDTLTTVCVTGKLDMTKSAMKDHLEEFGYKVVDTVTKNTDILICAGDRSSLKYQKAEKYGIPILDYWEHRTEILKGQL